jgi:uncharacterized membrane protein YeaQ/YmgE (transglycosylase-associated protein family)
VGLVGFLIVVVAGGLILGALARLAVPGPDPMPLWATAALGVVGSVLGGAATWLVFGVVGGLPVGFATSVVLLILYRRLVQKRGVTGPEAKRPPTRGWWLPRPPRARPPAPPEKLERLLAAGVITREEYEAQRAALRAGPEAPSRS